MKVENLSRNVSEFTCNVYRFGNVLVDTGEGVEIADELEKVEELEAVLMTHSHHDHVGRLEELVERFDPEVYCFDSSRLPVEAEELEDGQEFEVDGREIVALHTPGHIDDHLCYYLPEERALFTGDLVFAGGSFGRTDLEEGDREMLIKSIEKVIQHTDPESFYPGHDEPVLEKAAEMLQKSLENAEKREPKY